MHQMGRGRSGGDEDQKRGDESKAGRQTSILVFFAPSLAGKNFSLADMLSLRLVRQTSLLEFFGPESGNVGAKTAEAKVARAGVAEAQTADASTIEAKVAKATGATAVEAKAAEAKFAEAGCSKKRQGLR